MNAVFLPSGEVTPSRDLDPLVEGALLLQGSRSQGTLVAFAASTSHASAPLSPVVRYQKRSSVIQVGRTPPWRTSGEVLYDMNRSARA
jgi:hypothetical protein